MDFLFFLPFCVIYSVFIFTSLLPHPLCRKGGGGLEHRPRDQTDSILYGFTKDRFELSGTGVRHAAYYSKMIQCLENDDMFPFLSPTVAV